MRTLAIILLLATGCQAADKPAGPATSAPAPDSAQPAPNKPDRNSGCREVIINGFRKTLCA